MRRLTKIPDMSSPVHGLPLITTSDRQTAKALVVPHTTVAATCKEMEDKGKLIKFTISIGADDKERSRQVERKPVSEPAKSASLVCDRSRQN
jgi:hypothetical protein